MLMTPGSRAGRRRQVIAPIDYLRRMELLNAIRGAKALGSVQPIVNGICDGFGGSDGINAGASSGYSYDGTNKRVINSVTGGSGGVAVTDNSASMTTGSSGWSGNTVRTTIPGANVLVSGTQIRAKLKAGSAGFAADAVWIGHIPASPTHAWDFDGNQVQLLFSGSGSITAGSFAVVTSDYATFTLTAGNPLCVAVHFSSTSDVARVGAGLGVANFYFVAASNASTTSPAGYTLGASNDNILVAEVDAPVVAGSPSNIVLLGNSYSTADYQPAAIRALGLAEPVDAATVNTDITIEVSRDGSTYTSAPWFQYHTLGTKVLLESSPISVQGQPSAKTPSWRYKTFNNKREYLHGLALAW